MQSNEQSSKRKVTVSSGLAFALLPQFRYCFSGFKELLPLFGISLAIILSNAKLISKDHPILNNQRGYGIGDLMGEAWYTLRTTQATTSQWGVFTSIVMFAALFVSAVGTFVLRLGLGVGSVAHAQLFQAPGTPYGSGTDTTINGAVSTISATPTGALFDMRVQSDLTATGTVDSSKDYALMLLDKVLRQSAASTPNGGSMQNALASLMQVYNSGVLVVASVMIFWMIMSVVVDTAKTGTIGGGRHNMVWAPIRVVFALGIMIPLGSQGFSSGQYMVMKLAEWGSNFGSQGWTTYVTKVANGGDSLLLNYSASNVSSLVSSISQTLVCQVAYNAYSMQAGTTDADQLVQRSADTYNNLLSRSQFTYTTASSDNMCGTISYEKKNASGSGTYTDPLTGYTTSVAASSGGFDGYNRVAAQNMLNNPAFMAALNAFDDSMTDAIATQIGGGTGPVMTQAEDFACTFVARRFSDGGSGTNPVSNVTQPACSGKIDMCGGNHDPASGKDPDDSCQASMAKSITDAMKASYGTAATTLSSALTTALVDETKQRGWASAGMWFAEIAGVNIELKKALEPKIDVTPGVAWSAGDGVTCGLTGRIWHGFWNWTGLSSTKCVTDLQKQVGTVMEDYGRWWDYASAHHASPPATPNAEDGTNISASGSSSWTSIGRQLISGSSTDEDTESLANAIATKFTPKAVANPFFQQPLKGNEKGSYPLAQLSDLGSTLMWIGVGIDVLSTIGQALTGAIPVVGDGLANLFIWQTMLTIGNALITGGLVLLFWLPVMPALRVGFAAMTWITAVFIAVAMVPIAALAHLTSEGDGLSGGAKVAWTLWLNILLRPMLVVVGFVGAMLVYNSFAVYFNSMFGGVAAMVTSGGGVYALVGYFAFSAIYVLTLYSAANACFKMLDLVPDAMMTWMNSGAGGAASFDHAHGHAGGHMGSMAQGLAGNFGHAGGFKSAMAVGKLSTKGGRQEIRDKLNERKTPKDPGGQQA